MTEDTQIESMVTITGAEYVRLMTENAKLRAALEEITKVERYYGYEADEMLNIARAALGGEKVE